MSNHYENVKNYFNSKADNYDDVDDQLYWSFSDDFFKGVLKRESNRFLLDKKIKILDAGAGTGRWTLFVNEIFKDKFEISGTLIDISSKMLNVAKGKFEKLNLETNFKFVLGNIENMPNIRNNYYNLSISFYNVINFVKNPKKALLEINKKLEKGGFHISILASKYHSYYFSILTNRLEQIKEIKTRSKIKFNDDMPAIHCFTPEEAKNLYFSAGFREVKIFGGPNFIYPGMEETKIHGNTEEIQNKLINKDFYKELLDLELNNYDKNDIVGRANALIVVAQK